MMGGFISSLHRLRRSFFIETYLSGCGTHSSLHTLFDGLGHVNDGAHVLTKGDLTTLFGDQHQSLIYEITSLFDNNCVSKETVISFLQAGTLPKDFIDTFPYRDENKDVKTTSRISKNNDENRVLSVICTNTQEKPVADPPSNQVYRQSLWKKHETVIQERIVRHITIEDGVRRELVESDKSQNEVIHMECKETGEFAHREYSQQEQTEELDDEMATFIRATEEYVHLKSKVR